MIDTHAHLNDEKLFSRLDEVLQEAKSVGVEKIVCIGYDYSSSVLACKIAEENRDVYAVIGVHPHDAKTYDQNIEQNLFALAKDNKKVVAIGEIGLDYHYDFSPREVQREVFERQLNLANKLNLPIVIHTREAWEDTLLILNKNKNLFSKGIMHCFSGNLKDAQNCFELGLIISFGGSLTFDKTGQLENVLKNIDLDKFVLETDCPYMTPVPFRGKVNQPKYVTLVLEKIANILGLDKKEVEKITNKNAKRVFDL